MWREYAYEAGIDPVILAYLELRKISFLPGGKYGRRETVCDCQGVGVTYI
ncbi:MAG: hypothetical protein ACLUUO_03440 [Sellimonas intestinalis]